MLAHIDPHILHRADGYEITDDVHVVRFTDGSTLALHAVMHNGATDLFMRAAPVATDRWQRFDVRHAAPELGTDLPATMPRDVPGTISYTLRLAYPSAGALLAAVLAPRWICGPHNNELLEVPA